MDFIGKFIFAKLNTPCCYGSKLLPCPSMASLTEGNSGEMTIRITVLYLRLCNYRDRSVHGSIVLTSSSKAAFTCQVSQNYPTSGAENTTLKQKLTSLYFRVVSSATCLAYSGSSVMRMLSKSEPALTCTFVISISTHLLQVAVRNLCLREVERTRLTHTQGAMESY
ncbi:hypothetical protein Mapa_014166 [Marchantia paleacea]|nr:hypothetical protein Mapa_014166 [Marchantia paleacea]